MWQINTPWFDVAVVGFIYAIGNIMMGHFEEKTPKWRRILKYLITIILVLVINNYFGRGYAYGMIGLILLFAIYVHTIALPRKGINGWTGEPKEKYYELRGWKYQK
jgi:predicted MFS family arabinose efflux permease